MEKVRVLQPSTAENIDVIVSTSLTQIIEKHNRISCFVLVGFRYYGISPTSLWTSNPLFSLTTKVFSLITTLDNGIFIFQSICGTGLDIHSQIYINAPSDPPFALHHFLHAHMRPLWPRYPIQLGFISMIESLDISHRHHQQNRQAAWNKDDLW